ncbi:hypothetical protein AB0F71_18370 [Kitasatospora sp. NPDC028055]|uniref:hypothetical protein n=1 Tax=Kitasatospora sp. NPDC028055 TaxID=3155653 RepID=UPI0034101E0D
MDPIVTTGTTAGPGGVKTVDVGVVTADLTLRTTRDGRQALLDAPTHCTCHHAPSTTASPKPSADSTSDPATSSPEREPVDSSGEYGSGDHDAAVYGGNGLFCRIRSAVLAGPGPVLHTGDTRGTEPVRPEVPANS